MSFRGNRRGGSGIRPATKFGQACRQFRSTGKCTFGQRCKFSHDPSSSSASAPGRTYTQAPRIREPTDERVLKFKRLVTARTYGTSSSEQNLFSLGLEILTNATDADAQQQTISILATEDGLSCIRQVVESRIPRAMIAGTTFAKRRLWETDMRPLFRLITFESVVLSNILEDKVVTIYNFIAGVGGDRLPAWFDLAKGLAGAPDLPLSIASIEIAELCLAVMAKMMDCNSSHVSNPTFCDYATSFIAIATAFQDITPAHKMSKIQATEHAAIISRRLEARDTSSSARSLHSALANGSLSLHQDLPGSLSGNGPRHDNDHDDITKISILPTPDEIASDRKEYLPTVDPSLWHRSGIAGRLDREFRLLREDTIGQLRDVVRAELGNLQQKSNHGKPLKDTIQYCTYHDTSIFELGFDRRTGPEFIFRFRQPAGRSGTTSFQRGKAGSDKNDEEAKSLAQRRDWWMVRAKKRLQPGGLVCVIDSRGASHFLIVADSSARTAADTQKHQNGPANRSWQKDDDDGNGKTFTLADDPMWSFVSLKLPPDNNRDQLRDIMTQLFFKTKIKRFARSGSWVREHEPSCVLVEFPGILLDSFLPTLQALQATTTSLKVPFAKLLTAADNTSFDSTTGDMASIPPPKYAQLPGFEFNLSCLSQSGAGQTHLLSHGVDAPITAQEVEKQTRLDMTQSAALVDALSRSVALVQGPPGTGKTFAGVEILKVLLQNSKKANMGPILIVCYTNHALDQLLEHVLDARPKTQVIRMGSRSKSERLRDLNLFELSRTEERTRNERSSLYEFGLELDELTADFQKLSDKLTRSMSFSSIAAFLHDHHRSYSMQLFGSGSGFGDGVDDQGYTMVQQSKDKIFLAWMRGGRTDTENGNTPPPATAKQETMTEIRKRLQLLEDAAGLDILALNADERNVLYQKWQYESFTMAADAICREYEKFVSTKKSYDYARRETDLRCLQRAEIVGVTTTGLARNNNLLKNLRAKVLLCEEAGEVLEAHMLTSLLPSLEHLILIGDHQQLRPQVQNYDLRSDSARGAQYSFDMSLFERLVSPLNDEGVRLPFSQLFTQRRMHPSISDLIRAPLYPSLQDGSNVFEHPEVPGIERRLFWLQHDQLEQGASSNDRQADPTSTSRTNLFEVEMTAALVSHLFKQGAYGPGDIAVLTPYLGQMMLLQRRMSSMFEISFNERDEAEIETIAAVHAGKTVGEVSGAGVGDTGKAGVIARTTLSNSVRIATVDNFQGEEAKVVVISMVRSNEQHRCGFLSTSNRINVLLSRAKHGMYIIGNSDTCSRVPMWQQVIGNLEDGGNIGPALPLRCPRHPERRFEASRPEHFLQFAPDGGCLEPCSKPLPCKHVCRAPCHSDVIHTVVKCSEPCTRPQKGCSHSCPRKCSEACPPRCLAVMAGQELRLKCGHLVRDPACWQVQNPEGVQCAVDVLRTVPGCTHAVTVQCGVVDVKDERYKCRAPCSSVLKCGHTCTRLCYECNTRYGGVVTKKNHGSCQSPCGEPHETCAHPCRSKCHADEAGDKTKCPLCESPCETRCSHARCQLKCSEQCMPCTEKNCASHCPHSTCTLPCAAPCDWIPCSKRCEKELQCGHRCPSLCGEQCPSVKLCQVCCTSETRAQRVDLTKATTYGSTNLDEDPCIFLNCGHVLAASYMDNVAGMHIHYEMEAGTSGSPVSIRTPLAHFVTTEASTCCPYCRGRLYDVARYSRIVKQRQWDRSIQKASLLCKERLTVLAINLMGAMMADTLNRRQPISSRKNLWSGSRLKLMSSSSRTLVITKLLMPASLLRYQPLLELRDRISSLSAETRKNEQACQIVTIFGENGENKASSASRGEMRMGGYRQTRLLLLRCDAMALAEIARSLLSLRKALNTTSALKDSVVDMALFNEVLAVIRDNRLACFFKDCVLAFKDAQMAQNTRQENEAIRIYISFYVSHGVLGKLVLSWPLATAKVSGLKSIQEQDEFRQGFEEQRLKLDIEYKKYADLSPMQKKDVNNYSALVAAEDVPALISYSKACLAEMAASYKGMYAEFHGMSGRWYACANGHPFTTKGDTLSREEEMESVRCPECNAPAGGQQSGVDNIDDVDDVDELVDLGRHIEEMHV